MKQSVVIAQLNLFDNTFGVYQDKDRNATLVIGPYASRVAQRVSPVGPDYSVFTRSFLPSILAI